MKFGGSSSRLDAEFNPFADECFGEILWAVAVAWARMRKPKLQEWEDDITYRLAGRLQNDQILAAMPYDIVPQYWLLDLHGRRLGRLDLRFKHRHSQRDYFSFESKRLHVAYPGGTLSTEYPTYVSDEGMGAFVAGQYSRGLPAAGMLAYVMDGNTARAWSGIASRIEMKRGELRLLKASQLVESSLKHHIEFGLPETRLGETQHNLSSRTLRMFHLLLPVKQPS
jgi:hypothetical protein